MLEERGSLYVRSWDLFELGVVRPTDRNTAATKEDVFAHSSLPGGTAHHADCMEKNWSWAKDRSEGNTWIKVEKTF